MTPPVSTSARAKTNEADPAVAAELGCASVAFPAISTGVYGYPLDLAARTALRATADSLAELFQIELVTFVLFGHWMEMRARKGTNEAMRALFDLVPPQATVLREGTDVTVVAVGHLVHDALAVAEELAGTVSVEVFDPRWLYPLDRAGLEPAALRGYHTRAAGHLQVTAATAAGLADAGVASEPAALAYGLGFVPLTAECFDLVIPAGQAGSREVDALLKVLAQFDKQVDGLAMLFFGGVGVCLGPFGLLAGYFGVVLGLGFVALESQPALAVRQHQLGPARLLPSHFCRNLLVDPVDQGVDVRHGIVLLSRWGD